MDAAVATLNPTVQDAVERQFTVALEKFNLLSWFSSWSRYGIWKKSYFAGCFKRPDSFKLNSLIIEISQKLVLSLTGFIR